MLSIGAGVCLAVGGGLGEDFCGADVVGFLCSRGGSVGLWLGLCPAVVNS